MHPDLSIPGLGTALTAVSAPRQDFSVMREEAAPCTESSSKFRLQQRKDLRYEVVWELTTRLEDDNQQTLLLRHLCKHTLVAISGQKTQFHDVSSIFISFKT